MAATNSDIQNKLDSFFSKINKLDKIQKIGIFIGTIVLIVAVYVWFLYLPQKEEIESLKKKQENLSSQVSIAKTKVAQLEKIKKELENRQEEFLVVTKALPDTKEIPALVDSLSASANESGLTLESIVPGGENPKDFYAEIPISMKMSGGFHETALFFDKVSRFSRIVDFQNAKLTSDKDEKISTVCNALTYRFLKDKKNEDKKNTKKKKKK
ncbi:MAG: type 4a pilus biogenesis protein PilO [Desulforegulaceae bacterium]|nr:type 4a pilus biogenesis protein PilO [Desulforegulaceae bacterium]